MPIVLNEQELETYRLCGELHARLVHLVGRGEVTMLLRPGEPSAVFLFLYEKWRWSHIVSLRMLTSAADLPQTASMISQEWEQRLWRSKEGAG